MPFRIVGISIILHRILPYQMCITGYAMAYQMHPPVVEVHPPEANPSIHLLNRASQHEVYAYLA